LKDAKDCAGGGAVVMMELLSNSSVKSTEMIISVSGIVFCTNAL